MKKWNTGDTCFFRNADPHLIWYLRGIVLKKESLKVLIQGEDNRRYEVSSVLVYSTLEELQKDKNILNPKRFKIGSPVAFVFKPSDSSKKAIMLRGSVYQHQTTTVVVDVLEPYEMSGSWTVPPHRLKEIPGP